MTRIELAPEIADDCERILDHLDHYRANDPVARIREIIDAISVLETNPLTGRPGSDQRPC